MGCDGCTTAVTLLRTSLLLSCSLAAGLMPASTARPLSQHARVKSAVLLRPVLPTMEAAPDDDQEWEDAEEESSLEGDWDTAWQRYRLEALAEGWWQHFRLEALEGLPRAYEGPDLTRGLAVLIGVAAFMLTVKAYLSQAGGIVIVPDGVYNFNELKALNPEKLMQMGLPMPVLPPPEPIVLPIWRLLLGAHDIPPPA